MCGFLERRGRFYFILFIEQVTVLRIILFNLQMLKMTIISLFIGGGDYRSARLSKFISQVKKEWKSVSACVNRNCRCICVSTLAKLAFLTENPSTHIWCLHPTSFHTSKGTAWTRLIWASVPDIYRTLWRWTESWIWQSGHMLITHSVNMWSTVLRFSSLRSQKSFQHCSSVSHLGRQNYN